MRPIYFLLLISVFGTACVGDDIIDDRVDETLKITVQASSIAVGETFQFEARFTNNIGQNETGRVIWSSSDAAVLSIDQNGLATALSMGNVLVYAEVDLSDGRTLREEMPVEINDETTVVETATGRSGRVETTTFYDLEGDFTLTETEGKLLLDFADNYLASDALPGLYVYLSNNPNSISGAFEIGAVDVFRGAHSYEIEGVELADYDYVLYWCKPFRVKVGDGKIE